MKSLLLVHLVFVGIWLGCVWTEVLFERALLGKGRDKEIILVALHKRVDVIVEIPAFIIVLITGGLMLNPASVSSALYVKIGFGLLAIVSNIYCVWLVFRRAAAANQKRWDEFSRLDHVQHKFGALVLVGILAALIIGTYLFAHAF